MPFNTLLLHHLLPDKTAYTDKGTGLGITIKRQQNETILLFPIDDPNKPFIQKFKLQNKCDLIVFYQSLDKQSIAFVELKGSDFDKAVKQIITVYQSVFKVKQDFKNVCFKAFIIATGSAPNKSKLKPLKAIFGRNLYIKTGVKKGQRVSIDGELRK